MLHDGPLLPDPLAPANGRRLALLIDAENVPRDKVAAMVDAASSHGTAAIRRAYGDWAGGGLKGWSATLHDHAIRPIQQFSYTAHKNAADIALVIDAMELLHTCRLDGFCIASSDADFTPLVMHLRAHGRDVHGFGEGKTPRPFVGACTSFVDLGGLPSCPKDPAAIASIPVASPKPAKPAPSTPAMVSMAGDTSLVTLLRAAVKAAARGDGWAPMNVAGNRAKQAGVNPKAHKCKNFPDLFAAMKLFEIRKEASGEVLLTDRRNGARSSRSAS